MKSSRRALPATKSEASVVTRMRRGNHQSTDGKWLIGGHSVRSSSRSVVITNASEKARSRGTRSRRAFPGIPGFSDKLYYKKTICKAFYWVSLAFTGLSGKQLMRGSKWAWPYLLLEIVRYQYGVNKTAHNAIEFVPTRQACTTTIAWCRKENKGELVLNKKEPVRKWELAMRSGQALWR